MYYQFEIRYRCRRCGEHTISEHLKAQTHDEAAMVATHSFSHQCEGTDGRGVRGVAVPFEVLPVEDVRRL